MPATATAGSAIVWLQPRELFQPPKKNPNPNCGVPLQETGKGGQGKKKKIIREKPYSSGKGQQGNLHKGEGWFLPLVLFLLQLLFEGHVPVGRPNLVQS